MELTASPFMPAEDPSLARKRRKELRALQRGEDDLSGEGTKRQRTESVVDEVPSEEIDHTRPSLRGIKKQARYEPGVPMSRDELTQWRKEARRVRNRESAAASRQKTRERIEELEAEVDALRAKYSAALERIVELEANDRNHANFFTPTKLRQDMQVSCIVSPSPSLPSSPVAQAVSAAQAPETSFSLDEPHLAIQEKAEESSLIENHLNMISDLTDSVDSAFQPWLQDMMEPAQTKHSACSTSEVSEVSSSCDESSNSSDSSSNSAHMSHHLMFTGQAFDDESGGSTNEEDEEDLHAFLCEALDSFDPTSTELTALCE